MPSNVRYYENMRYDFTHASGSEGLSTATTLNGVLDADRFSVVSKKSPSLQTLGNQKIS